MGAPVESGQIVAGKYRVDRILGKGGMGTVVAAMHVDLREPRALKFMSAEARAEGEGAVERFLREGRAASRLKGAHVARVFDVGRLDDGTPYLVMEYLDGADLHHVLKQRGRLPVSEVALYLLQACEALAEAHARGIVHRDLKPANLFLAAGADAVPSIKLLDFGISKVAGDTSVTKSQTVLGSPHYMPPEQFRSSRDVDPRADVWSLGVIAYQLLCGHLPFQGRNVTEVITAVVSAAPAPLSAIMQGADSLPPGLEGVVLRCLAKHPGDRPASVAELAAALVPFAPPEGERHLTTIERLLAGGRGSAPRLSDPGAAPSSQRTPAAQPVTTGETPPVQPATGSDVWGASSRSRIPSSLIVGLVMGLAAAVVGMLVFVYAFAPKVVLSPPSSPALSPPPPTAPVTLAVEPGMMGDKPIPPAPAATPATTGRRAAAPAARASSSSSSQPASAVSRTRPEDPRVFGDRK
jgi:serine/threonine-protein kinase